MILLLLIIVKNIYDCMLSSETARVYLISNLHKQEKFDNLAI